ncbi:VCBS repeat-containing protein [Winogradskyella sp. DF17]|uniref:VCBS repeat-containing protein n=1 Tax=Winogradskyella pelagia TaxID=2819984 RepID=A0ABS3T3N6_9FLAO|nr:FG-GAP-like repeat-containing protein [Winogradskyella sp. DF17]MBO3117362.1 VCBS repeat-containing protein [Winogradskyella sp. DF17]
MKLRLCFYSILLCALNTLYGQINFVDQAELIGLSQATGTSNFGGHGISYADFDDNGLDDITLASGNGVPVRFYKNIEGFVFAEVDLLATLNYDYRTRSVVWVDFDNDGDKDLFLTSDTDGNRLFQNQNGVLTDITVAAGFPLENLFTYGASWGDIDNDGCLDVYLSNRIGGTNITNYLFKNNCDGTFSEVTTSVGLSNTPYITFCSAFFDFNNDGWQDLYVANDKFEQNYLYKNNGDGTYTDVSVSSGTNIVMDAMSVTIDDFNSDGFFDIYITNTPQEISTPLPGSVLLRNNGDETFSNISLSSGTVVDSYCWGANFIDADNDTDLDLYVNSQYTGDNGFASYAFFTNSGDETFAQPSNVGFDTNTYRSYSSAVGDYNNDGLMEIVVNNEDNQKPSLWENIANNTNNYLAVELEGVIGNRDGTGSVIEIAINGAKQYRYTLCGEGYLSQNSTKKIFGLGTNTTVDYVKVTWLSGIVDIIYNVTANQTLNIVEGSATLSIGENIISRINYYPNPVKNSLTLRAGNDTIKDVKIFNLLGQEVLQTRPNALISEIDMSHLQTGVYIVKINSAAITETVRVIKQ